MELRDLSIVTSGRLSQEFFLYVKKAFPEIRISQAKSKPEIVEKIKDANCYAGFYDLDGIDFSHLNWIHAFAAGVEKFIEHHSFENADILISRSTGDMGRKMGEYCVAHVLNLFQNIQLYRDLQLQKQWKQLPKRALAVSNILILGTGTIGQGVANCFRALGSRVIGINTTGRPHTNFDETLPVEDISTLAESVDVCINCLPLTRKTANLFDFSFFQCFRDVVFINIGRGKSAHANGIIRALNQGYISHAILDVFPAEPLPFESELWTHPQIIITPHVSGISTLEDVKIGFEKALSAYLAGDSKAFVDKRRGY